jgi:hypothetical protein
MNAINKDNAGSIVLLVGMFLVSAAALFSAADVSAAPTQAKAQTVTVETIVVTATHLK